VPVRPSGKDRLKRKQVGKWRRQNDEKLTEARLINTEELVLTSKKTQGISITKISCLIF
jgi:hypothetical protein